MIGISSHQTESLLCCLLYYRPTELEPVSCTIILWHHLYPSMFRFSWLVWLVQGPQVCVQSYFAHKPCSAGPSSLSLWIPSSANSFRTLFTQPQPCVLGRCTVLLGTARVISGSPAVLVFSSIHGLVSSKGAGYAPLFLSPPLKLPNLSSTSEPASVRNRTIT